MIHYRKLQPTHNKLHKSKLSRMATTASRRQLKTAAVGNTDQQTLNESNV
jgi:hypothetical protein